MLGVAIVILLCDLFTLKELFSLRSSAAPQLRADERSLHRLPVS